MLAWMLYATFVALAAGAAAHALDAAARALGRQTRFAWLMALLLSTILPAWRLARSVLPSVRHGAVADAVLLPPVIIGAGRDAAGLIANLVPATGRVASIALLAAWFLTTIVLLARLLRGMRAVSRQRRSWMLRELDGVPVLVSPRTGPAIVGVRFPMVVLPEWALTLDPGLRRRYGRGGAGAVRGGSAGDSGDPYDQNFEEHQPSICGGSARSAAGLAL